MQYIKVSITIINGETSKVQITRERVNEMWLTTSNEHYDNENVIRTVILLILIVSSLTDSHSYC